LTIKISPSLEGDIRLCNKLAGGWLAGQQVAVASPQLVRLDSFV